MGWRRSHDSLGVHAAARKLRTASPTGSASSVGRVTPVRAVSFFETSFRCFSIREHVRLARECEPYLKGTPHNVPAFWEAAWQLAPPTARKPVRPDTTTSLERFC